MKGCRGKRKASAGPLYVATVHGEEARDRAIQELRAMVRKLAAEGVEIFAIGFVLAVPDGSGDWLVNASSVGVDSRLNEALQNRVREALDLAAEDAGYGSEPSVGEGDEVETVAEVIQ